MMFKFAADARPAQRPAHQLQPGRAQRRPRRPHRRRRPRRQTAWMATTGRPDVSIAVLDSGIKWNDAGRDERPPAQDPPQPRRAADARATTWPGDSDRRHERLLRAYADAATTPTATASSTSTTTPATAASRTSADPRRVGPAGMLTPAGPADRLLRRRRRRRTTATSTTSPAGTSSTTTTTPSTTSSTATAPARPATRPRRPTTAGGAGTCPNCMVDPAARRRQLHRRRRTASPQADTLRDRQRRRRRPGGARHDEQLEPRAPGRGLRLQATASP